MDTESQPTRLPYLDRGRSPKGRMVEPDNPFVLPAEVLTESVRPPRPSKAQLRWLPEDLGDHPPEGPLLQLRLHRM